MDKVAGKQERSSRRSMTEIFNRTIGLLGEDAVKNLGEKHIAIFGIGGVGGYVCEALVRSGIGEFTIVDKDVVDITNINRQIIALQSTVGKNKTTVMRERMLDINPSVKVHERTCFFLPENADTFNFSDYDYVVDAVDTVTAKLEIIARAKKAGIPVISAMGAGNKLDAGRFRVSDIEKTSVCPLAKVMRRELKKRGISGVKVVWSDEKPAGKPVEGKTADRNSMAEEASVRKAVPASISYVPAVAGLMMAGEIISDLVKD